MTTYINDRMFGECGESPYVLNFNVNTEAVQWC